MSRPILKQHWDETVSFALQSLNRSWVVTYTAPDGGKICIDRQANTCQMQYYYDQLEKENTDVSITTAADESIVKYIVVLPSVAMLPAYNMAEANDLMCSIGLRCGNGDVYIWDCELKKVAKTMGLKNFDDDILAHFVSPSIAQLAESWELDVYQDNKERKVLYPHYGQIPKGIATCPCGGGFSFETSAMGLYQDDVSVELKIFCSNRWHKKKIKSMRIGKLEVSAIFSGIHSAANEYYINNLIIDYA